MMMKKTNTMSQGGSSRDLVLSPDSRRSLNKLNIFEGSRFHHSHLKGQRNCQVQKGGFQPPKKTGAFGLMGPWFG